MSGRTAAGLGHHAWKTPVLVNWMLIAGLFLPKDWFWPLMVVVFGIYAIAFHAVRRHDHDLCERCISEMPLNPQALILRRDRALRWEHKEDRFKSRKATAAAAIFGPVVLAGAAIAFTPGWVSWILFVLWVGVYQTYDILATRMHKILQPWCPYCRRDPGGGSFSPDPLPQPTEKANR